MKKLSLLVALALLVSFGAFAQVSLDYSVTGSATMEWGIDLNNDPMTHGFSNSTESSLDLSVTLDPASVMADGSNIYGMIELTGFGVEVGDTVGVKWDDVVKVYDEDGDDYTPTNDAEAIVGNPVPAGDTYDYTFINTGIKVTKPDVAAKVVLSDALFVKIASKPDFDYNNAEEAVDGDGFVGIDQDYTGGVTVGYMSDMVDVNVNFVSGNDGPEYDTNPAGDYAVGGDITIKPADMVTATLYGAYNPNFSSTTPVYLGLNLDLAPVDMLSVNVGVDAGIPESGDALIDVDLSIPVTVTDAISVTAAGSFVKNGAADAEMDASVGIAVTGDAALTLDALFDDVTDTTSFDIELDLTASYKAMLSDDTYVKPGVEFGYDMAAVDADDDDTVNLLVYVDAALISNTVFTLAYESVQLKDAMVAADETAMDKGDIKFTTKISY